MTLPLVGPRRLLRVGVLGSATMLLATGAHLSGGGQLPGVGLLAVTTFLVGLVAVTATTRRCRLRLLLPLLAAEQAVLHVVFDAAGAGAACDPAAGHALHAAAPAPGCLPAEAMVMTTPGWTMWLGHLAATVVTAWLLTRAEAALWALAERVVRAAGVAPGSRPTRRRPAVSIPPLTALVAVLLAAAAARAPPVCSRPSRTLLSWS